MKRILVVVLVTIGLIPIVVAVGGVMYFDHDTWKSGYRLSKALRNARSVSFTEYTPADEGGVILARRAATVEDISRFRRATSPWFLPFKPQTSLCFFPHHSVEIVAADGTELTFLVCFLCSNFDLISEDPDVSTGWAVDLPPSWDKSLRSFFASIGMAPKTQAEYQHAALYHKGANDQNAKPQPK